MAVGYATSILEVLFRESWKSSLQLVHILLQFHLDIFYLVLIYTYWQTFDSSQEDVDLIFLQMLYLLFIFAYGWDEIFKGEGMYWDHAVYFLAVFQEHISKLSFLHVIYL